MADRPIRAFLAVPLRPDLRPAVAALQERLQPAQAKVKWVEAENLHFTLKFLGDTRPERGQEIAAAVRSAVQRLAPFEVTIAGAGAFPHTRRPRTVWVGTREGAEPLAALAAAVEEALAALGLPRETKPFRPHLTIGRVKGPDFLRTLGELIEAEADTPIGRQTVDSCCLMQSELKRSGPIYTVLADIPLGGVR
jgi:2'-5' RNA ligase